MPQRAPTQAEREADLASLFAAHGSAVLAYARRRTDDSAAEDVVSETFLIAWRKLDRVPDEPRPWLLAVARRVLANQQRGVRRREALTHRLAAEPVAAAAPAVDLDTPLQEALAALSAKDREALALVHWDDLTPAQAAEVLGVTGIAFRARLSRARRRLAAHLQAAEDPDAHPAAPRPTTATQATAVTPTGAHR